MVIAGKNIPTWALGLLALLVLGGGTASTKRGRRAFRYAGRSAKRSYGWARKRGGSYKGRYRTWKSGRKARKSYRKARF